MLKINNNEVVISSHNLRNKVDFINTNNLTKITTLNNIECGLLPNGIKFISNIYFIVGGYKLYIINSNTRTINKIISPPIICNSIVVVGEMIIFSTYNKTLIIYKIISENEIQFIQEIDSNHKDFNIEKFSENQFVSFSLDGSLKFWGKF